MSEHVNNLRELARCDAMRFQWLASGAESGAQICKDAADEIERLERVIMCLRNDDQTDAVTSEEPVSAMEHVSRITCAAFRAISDIAPRSETGGKR